MAAETDFILRNLSIAGESDPGQLTNFAPVFRWEYSRPAEDYLLKLRLFCVGEPADSLIWESGIMTTTDSSFQFSGLGVFEKGRSYRFYAAAKHPELGWSDSARIEFTINTPPIAPRAVFRTDTVFLEKIMQFPIAPAEDAQIAANSLLYQVRIIRDPDGRQIELDTTFRSLMEPSGFTTDLKLADNRRYFLTTRAYDGVEYSAWSAPAGFIANRINEPPRRFRLKAPADGTTVRLTPLLSWETTDDPDDGFGTGLNEYVLEIATDPYFRNIKISRSLPKNLAEWDFRECNNHVRYFWRVTARDMAGLETICDRVYNFVTDLGNRPPAAPYSPAPVREKIVRPTDYLEWTLGEDPDSDRDFSCEIVIRDKLNPEKLFTIILPDTLLKQAQAGAIAGLSRGYDGRVRWCLNRIANSKFLSDDRVYEWQVRVTDGWGGSAESNWTESAFRFDDGINQPPLPPVRGFSPDKEIVNTHTPELKWEAAVDPDIADRLRYEIVLSRESGFGGRTYISEESAYNRSAVKIRTPLLENRQYFWRVRSIDLSDTKSAWSKTCSFWVNSINEAPDRPVQIVSPQNLEELTPQTVVWWLPANDPDPCDQLTYQIEFSTTPIFINPVLTYRIPQPLSSRQADTQPSIRPDALGINLYAIPQIGLLKDNALYYCRVLAVDRAGLIGISASQPIRVAFNLKNDPPHAVAGGFIPTNGVIVKTLRPEIRWDASRDPDFGDYQPQLTYQIELSANSQFIENETEVFETSAGQTALTIPHNLAENERFFYRVRARDQHGSYSLWSPINSFITNAANEAPYPVTAGFLPKDSMVVETTEPLISWLPAEDPDPDQNERDLFYRIRYYYIADNKKKISQLATKVGVTSVHLPELKEDQYYYYQIAAIDPDGKSSEWSQTICFGVNAYNQPPLYFQLLAPYFGQDSVAMNAGFFWKTTYDKDPGSRLIYTLHYATDSLFYLNNREIVFEQPATDTIMSYFPPEQLSYATRYFWKVVATDEAGNQKWASGTDSRPFVFNTIGLRHAPVSDIENFALHQNYPNPFNSETLIRYDVPVYGPVDITIYDLIGMKIVTLVNGNHSAGSHQIFWNGTDQSGSLVANGVYICRLTARGFSTHIKVVFLR